MNAIHSCPDRLRQHYRPKPERTPAWLRRLLSWT